MPHTVPNPSRAKVAGGARRRDTDSVDATADARQHTRPVVPLKPTQATSRRMRQVRRTGTAPELQVRRALSRHGIRYRVSNRDIAGSPDLANRNRRWVIFVHGCFWHRHEGCARATTPARNTAYWQQKFIRNVQRDAYIVRSLRKGGWWVYVIWECRAARTADRVAQKIAALPQREKDHG